MAQITLSLEEYQILVDARKEAENKTASLQHALADLKLIASDPGTVKALTDLARHALTLARFAVGNLPPESTRGWPVESLEIIGSLLPALPTFTVDDGDLGREFHSFAQEVRRFDRRHAAMMKSKPESETCSNSSSDS